MSTCCVPGFVILHTYIISFHWCNESLRTNISILQIRKQRFKEDNWLKSQSYPVLNPNVCNSKLQSHQVDSFSWIWVCNNTALKANIRLDYNQSSLKKKTIEHYLKYPIVLEFNFATSSLFLLSHLQPKLPRKSSHSQAILCIKDHPHFKN